MQAGEPAAALNVPAGHKVADVAPGPVAKDPADAGSHTSAATDALKNPGLHRVADDAPAEATYEPFEAAVHVVDPS